MKLLIYYYSTMLFLVIFLYVVTFISITSRSSYIYFSAQLLLVCLFFIIKFQGYVLCIPKVSLIELQVLHTSRILFKNNISSLFLNLKTYKKWISKCNNYFLFFLKKLY